MTSRARRHTSDVVAGQPLPALLTVPEIADLCGKHRHSVRRLLTSSGVSFRKSGRRLLVVTSTLRREMPDLVQAIEERLLQRPSSVDTRT